MQGTHSAAATTVDETSVSDQPGHRQSRRASRKPSMQPQTEEPAEEPAIVARKTRKYSGRRHTAPVICFNILENQLLQPGRASRLPHASVHPPKQTHKSAAAVSAAKKDQTVTRTQVHYRLQPSAGEGPGPTQLAKETFMHKQMNAVAMFDMDSSSRRKSQKWSQHLEAQPEVLGAVEEQHADGAGIKKTCVTVCRPAGGKFTCVWLAESPPRSNRWKKCQPLRQVPPSTPVVPPSSGRGQQFYEPMEDSTFPGIGRGKKKEREKEKKQEKEQICGKLVYNVMGAHRWSYQRAQQRHTIIHMSQR
ncbi:hypothetical protein LSAT2_027010 [Lamellibrachia satsuma]|nr:hypothetical protein LSAT2_027010 [Lamellibrachia satsuma]